MIACNFTHNFPDTLVILLSSIVLPSCVIRTCAGISSISNMSTEYRAPFYCSCAVRFGKAEIVQLCCIIKRNARLVSMEKTFALYGSRQLGSKKNASSVNLT